MAHRITTAEIMQNQKQFFQLCHSETERIEQLPSNPTGVRETLEIYEQMIQQCHKPSAMGLQYLQNIGDTQARFHLMLEGFYESLKNGERISERELNDLQIKIAQIDRAIQGLMKVNATNLQLQLNWMQAAQLDLENSLSAG